MKAVDGLIAVIGIVALGLAALVVLRARDATQPTASSTVPPAHAALPPDQDFPACRSQPEGLARWRCQADQARRQGRMRCIGQRLYYVVPGPDHGTPRFYRWPASLQCWTAPASSTP